MSRLPLVLAFVAGLACATLLGAAAPRAAPAPIEWQYRWINGGDVVKGWRAAAADAAKRDRAKFDSDSAAYAAGYESAYRTWIDGEASDGWFFMSKMEFHDSPSVRWLMARPAGRRVRVSLDPLDHAKAGRVADAARIEYEKSNRRGDSRAAELAAESYFTSAASSAGRAGNLLIRHFDSQPFDWTYFGVTIQ